MVPESDAGVAPTRGYIGNARVCLPKNSIQPDHIALIRTYVPLITRDALTTPLCRVYPFLFEGHPLFKPGAVYPSHILDHVYLGSKTMSDEMQLRSIEAR